MPGRSPSEAVEAFLAPLKGAVGCLGSAHLTLTRGARGDIGEAHSWTLNEGRHMPLGSSHGLTATMHFETLDQGSSRGSERFRVSTRGYMYALTDASGVELMSAHWHPTGRVSDFVDPHWHFSSAAISPVGVFLERAHVPSPRISFEFMVRWILENVDDVEPTCDDWRERLERTEEKFDQHKSW